MNKLISFYSVATFIILLLLILGPYELAYCQSKASKSADILTGGSKVKAPDPDLLKPVDDIGDAAKINNKLSIDPLKKIDPPAKPLNNIDNVLNNLEDATKMDIIPAKPLSDLDDLSHTAVKADSEIIDNILKTSKKENKSGYLVINDDVKKINSVEKIDFEGKIKNSDFSPVLTADDIDWIKLNQKYGDLGKKDNILKLLGEKGTKLLNKSGEKIIDGMYMFGNKFIDFAEKVGDKAVDTFFELVKKNPILMSVGGYVLYKYCTNQKFYDTINWIIDNPGEAFVKGTGDLTEECTKRLVQCGIKIPESIARGMVKGIEYEVEIIKNQILSNNLISNIIYVTTFILAVFFIIYYRKSIFSLICSLPLINRVFPQSESKGELREK
jgi:hypothetical protein